ncbi:hypothetical protein Tco_1472529 [Tanacetum coccineum]
MKWPLHLLFVSWLVLPLPSLGYGINIYPNLNFDTINDLAKNDLLIGLSKFKYHKEHVCPSCKQGKSKKASHPPKPVPNLKQRLHLLHMDLCGLMRVESINRKRVYNQRTRKIIETMNVTFDELSVMDFEQHSSKPGLQGLTSRQISSRLDLTYAPSTITSQKTTERESDLMFEAMYDDYIGGQPSAAPRTSPATPTPQDVDELSQQHVQQQDTQAPLQSDIVDDNVPNAMFDGDIFENPFAPPSTSAAESSSSQYVDQSNMHTFYQPYQHDYQWTKDHFLEQVIGEPSRPVLTRNQL